MQAKATIPLSILKQPTRFLFFTGKGGVGKTTLACAVALQLCQQDQRVLIVSTDPASNLDEMLATPLANTPRPIKDVPGLYGMNIDPEAAADAYRTRVLSQLPSSSNEDERSTVREQLSGACTTEIAAFDEFAGLLSGEVSDYTHVIFDTAPTGHTLRLLSLPKAWTGFLKDNDRGASCLGPHSGLKMQEQRFQQALSALSDPQHTTIVLVTRPDRNALREAARTSDELRLLGLSNQHLMVNGRFFATSPSDAVANALQSSGEAALQDMPASLKGLPRDDVPMRAFDMVGLEALRNVLSAAPALSSVAQDVIEVPSIPNLARLVDDIAQSGSGLVMVMGKGGVGKTTIAAAIAIGLVQRGHDVHLSTTDPAAHIATTVDGEMKGLKVDRIDPKAETQAYIGKIMRQRAADLDADGLALLREDLESPCTEEVAVFHAFSRIVAEARSTFVVLDTAPTGHTLLLMDATGAYHRQMTKAMEPDLHGRVITPLMRLQNPEYSKIILVTLPETTPVSEAAALQDDLRRAKIEPFAWVINRSLAGTGTTDPMLRARIRGEAEQIKRVRRDFARKTYLLPWQPLPPAGLPALAKLASADKA
jgi:arsenite-transporting ATPase